MTTRKAQPTILDEIAAFLSRFLSFNHPEDARIIALWVLHSWTFSESFPRTPWVTPYLYAWSDTPGAGKSTLIRVLRTLVRSPEVSGDITSAAMFKMIEFYRPTLLIDEVDTVFNGSGAGNESLRRTMNTGYEASGSAIRGVGNEAQKYSTFCAKLLAGINDLNSDIPETVRTRSIPIRLVKGHPAERFYAHVVGPEAEELSARIEQWVRDHAEQIIDYMPDVIESMEPRAFEISFPLLQLAKALGIEKEARTALIRMLTPPPPKDKPEIALLRIIRETFDEEGTDTVHTAKLIAKLNERLGGGWNGHLFGSKVGRFVDGSAGTYRVNGKPAKGYKRHQFEDAFGRYLG